MADDPTPANTVTPAVRNRSKTQGDVPDAMARRYYTDGRGGAGLGFYADAKIEKPAFRDEGGKLATNRTDPNAIRDMARIAQHRGWSVVTVRGEQNFRREAWLAGRALGLEVRGYRPTERDIQELDRRIDRRLARQEPTTPDQASPSHNPRTQPPEDGREQLRIIEAVVRARIAEPSAQARVIAAARERVSKLLSQGTRFRPPPQTRQAARRERDRAR